ncbi:MAG TPA: SprT family zinc-dependent metalloprotease [Bacilli bacterium]|nr:SprT family zinc-dependent metalloprotease [Bacilli bacterium]
MQIDIDNNIYEVVIERKNIKNMYLRIKDDLKIYITAPILITNKMIINFITNNEKYILKRINKIKEKEKNGDKFKYLGKYYDIVYTNDKSVEFGESKVFVGKDIDIDKFYKKMAKKEFLERLDIIYQRFNKTVPYPSLKIRKMTTRWGVCNVKLKAVTLNQELIKYGYDAIDYVIVHELCHFYESNHSSKFWNKVNYYYPNYKEIRKELKD